MSGSVIHFSSLDARYNLEYKQILRYSGEPKFLCVCEIGCDYEVFDLAKLSSRVSSFSIGISIGRKPNDDERILSAVVLFEEVDITCASVVHLHTIPMVDTVCGVIALNEVAEEISLDPIDELRAQASSNYRHTRTWAAISDKNFCAAIIDSGFGTGAKQVYSITIDGREVGFVIDTSGVFESVHSGSGEES